jgi:putative DNA methylase
LTAGDELTAVTAVPKRKLIEVALPLEAINREAAREKSIRHGHPSTLHLWWARRPLAAARAVLFAQLVDDPSSHPDRFPTEKAQAAERERLHKLIERLVVWENIRDEEMLAEAHEEILASTDGNPPPILDPFAGGGTIPLEAQRLGLEAHASDLNPVAVLINKALIEIPPKFADRPPVFPGLAETELAGWSAAAGLAADVRAYGEWMRDEAEKRIGKHYPKATLPDGGEANVIAWIWARTVTCPNPACGIEMPLVRSWWLGKKKGKEAYVVPQVVDDTEHPSGKRVEFEIGHYPAGPGAEATKNRQGARCVACGSQATQDEIKRRGLAGDLGAALMAVVAEGDRRRVYLPPTNEHEVAAEISRAADVPDQELGYDPRNLWTPAYGLTHFSDLFTNRQLMALTMFSDLVSEARERVLADGLAAGMPPGERLTEGGEGGEAYADAVVTAVAMAISRSLNKSTAVCSWDSSPKMEAVRGLFARQAIPMAWDFAEANIFASSSGSFLEDLDWVVRALRFLPSTPIPGEASQGDAVSSLTEGHVISTDPPYYDNIGYSDLSDFFYVWVRRSLRDVHPDLLGTMLVPKAEELVANPYRQDGKDGAKQFFEDGFRKVFARAREGALADFPITVYYAFKQSDAGKDGEASTGWETLLDGMIGAGWAITGTWPMRSELANRMLSQGTNALASSIVLALRPRPEDAPTTDRRGLIAALQDELPDALRDLQQGRIAPVDLPQAAIGPGMAVFSRYSSVIEPDGSKMTVRAALARINEILDQVLNEQEGDFDPTTRFALSWYRQHGYETGEFGEANNLANARNTSVEAMARGGVLSSAAGKVALIAPGALGPGYDPATDDQISAWEVLHHMIAAIDRDGIDASAEILASAGARDGDPVDADLAKELAFLLSSIAEKSGRTKDALAFNSLATSWPDIVDAMREGSGNHDAQVSLDF